jgi:O-antigen/teichoic acid export membrane protein
MRFWRDSFLLGTGNAISQLITLISLPVIITLYSPSDFGSLYLLTTIAAVLLPIGTYKLELVVALSSNSKEAHKTAMFGTKHASLVALSVFILGWCMIYIFSNNLLFESMMISFFLASALLLQSLSMLNTYSFLREGLVRNVNYASVIQNSSTSIAQIILGLLDPSALNLLLGYLFGRSLGLIYYLLTRNKTPRMRHLGLEVGDAQGQLYVRNLNVVLLAFTEILFLSLPVVLTSLFFTPEKVGIISLVNLLLMAPAALFGTALGSIFISNRYLDPGPTTASIEKSKFDFLDLFRKAPVFLGAYLFGCLILGKLMSTKVIDSNWIKSSDLIIMYAVPCSFSIFWPVAVNIFLDMNHKKGLMKVYIVRIMLLSVMLLCLLMTAWSFTNLNMVVYISAALTQILAYYMIYKKIS